MEEINVDRIAPLSDQEFKDHLIAKYGKDCYAIKVFHKELLRLAAVEPRQVFVPSSSDEVAIINLVDTGDAAADARFARDSVRTRKGWETKRRMRAEREAAKALHERSDHVEESIGRAGDGDSPGPCALAGPAG